MPDKHINPMDRRGFLRGTAGVGAGVAAGSLFGLGLAQTASAAELGLTKQYPVPGYPGATLPFPTNPGAFLQAALKTCFGALQACLCVTPAGVFRMVGMPDPVDITLAGAIGVTIGEGTSKKGKNVVEQVIHMLLHPTDHFTDSIGSLAGGVTSAAQLLGPGGQVAPGTTDGALGNVSVEHDGTRQAPPSGLAPLDPVRVFARFTEKYLNPIKWPGLIAAFFKDPIGFFLDALTLFFPAQQEMSFNIKCKSDKIPGVTLVNREAITMANGSVKEFPPRNAGYGTAGTVELVDVNNQTGPAVVTIDKFDSVVSHADGAPDKLSKEFVVKNVSKVVQVESATRVNIPAKRLATMIGA